MGFLEQAMLGNSWTPAIPSMVLLGICGVYLLLKTAKQSAFTLVATFIFFYVSYMYFFVLKQTNSFSDFFFLDNWYRAILFVLVGLIPLAGVGFQGLMTRVRTRIGARFITYVFVAMLLLHVYDGRGIVRSAWIRNPTSSLQDLKVLDALRDFKQIRTLNDPTDGSSWAYARIGMNITSPNDRGEYLFLGSLIEKLGIEAYKSEVCAAIREQNVEAVLWVNGPVEKIRSLQKSGLIDELLLDHRDIVLGRLSATFLNSC